ncbi:hypothetical protein DFH11DRAFT_1614655 [Phellopilus nigrolimitatus]|nr:hypothetical protein DFH11DRAFT_1614655 [Phellopilus nigrolimitatus]
MHFIHVFLSLTRIWSLLRVTSFLLYGTSVVLALRNFVFTRSDRIPLAVLTVSFLSWIDSRYSVDLAAKQRNRVRSKMCSV